jgi:hypothetical protein
MHKCPWCTVVYANWQNLCDQCGGPMPPPPGMDIGPPPPEAPRTIPKTYAFRIRWSRNIALIIGLAFTVFGGFLTSVFFFVNKWIALIPLFFFIGGFFMARLGWKNASATLKAFRYGQAVKGKIHSVSRDTSQSVNGKHPLLLVYHFDVDGILTEGVLSSFDTTLTKRFSGEPIWVLYVKEDPTKNAIYPPLA